MTREEACRRIKGYLYDVLDWKEAEEIIKALEQPYSDVCISSQAVLGLMQMSIGDKELYKALYDLPPDTSQKSKDGYWIKFKSKKNGYYHIKCSNCGQYWSVDGHAKVFKYCFNCGKKMQGVEE